MNNQDAIKSSPPLVAIVGRPNVGKSTLFNRLLGRRVAVVHDEAGTTRDRIYGEVSWDGRYFQVVDTGGLVPGHSEGLAAAVGEQVMAAVRESALCLLVVDLKDGLTHLDREVAQVIRETGKPVIVAMNKMDSKQGEDNQGEFASLGFDAPAPVSALHGLAIGELLDLILERLPDYRLPPQTEGTNIAIVGRPNVGKSTLVNALLGEERVVVDSTPGTTRDAVDTPFPWRGKDYILVDTAGLLKKSHSQSALSRFSMSRTVRSIDRTDVVLLLLEVSQPPTRVDTHFIEMALEKGKACVIGVNKWDLARGINQRGYLQTVRDSLPFAGFLPVVFFSALKKQSLDSAMEACDYAATERRREVPTGILNRVVQQAREGTAPRRMRGKQLKIFYAVQVHSGPPLFRLFVNDPSLMPPAYEHYLSNRLREAFGFEGTPLRFELKARSRR
jgi:GTP-binding protein